MPSLRLASVQLISWNILERYNVDPMTIFAKVGLNPQLMYEEEGRYPLYKILALWDEMACVIKDESFGLVASHSWHPSYFGTLGYSLLMSPCLRSTLEKILKYSVVVASDFKCKIVEDPSGETLKFVLPAEKQRVGTAAREDVFVSCLLSVLQTNYPRKLMPVSVNLMHANPKRPGKYFDHFRAPVNFEAQETAITLKVKDVDYILPVGSVKTLAGFSEQEMTSYLRQKKRASFSYRTTQEIEENLTSGDLSLENVAASLSVSPKSLQRLLREEGTCFKFLLEEVRMDLATYYLKKNSVELSEVSYLLGFSEQSAFSRFFKKQSGKSPARYRKEHP